MINSTTQHGSIERIDDLIGAKLLNIFTRYDGSFKELSICTNTHSIFFIYKKDEKEYCLEYLYDSDRKIFQIVDIIGESSHIIDHNIVEALLIKSRNYEVYDSYSVIELSK